MIKIKKINIIYYILWSILVLFHVTSNKLQASIQNVNKTNLQPTHKSKKIWVHIDEINEINSIAGLLLYITSSYNINNNNIFISTKTLKEKKLAQYYFDKNQIQVLPNDDFFTIANYISTIKPDAILMFNGGFCPPIVSFANILKIPIYLLNAQYQGRIEKLLKSHNFLYTSLLNTYSAIFTITNKDKIYLKDCGIKSPLLPIGLIDYCGIELKIKHESSLISSMGRSILKYIKNPILTVHPYDKDNISFYLDLYTIVKKKIPNLKLIIGSPTNENLLHLYKRKNQGLGLRMILLGEGFIEQLVKKKLSQSTIKKLLVENDVFFSENIGMGLLWSKAASVSIFDEISYERLPWLVIQAFCCQIPLIQVPYKTILTYESRPDSLNHSLYLTSTNINKTADEITNYFFSEKERMNEINKQNIWLKNEVLKSQKLIDSLLKKLNIPKR